MKNILKFGKRAQGGATITWFGAFILMVFIMTIFVAISISIAGGRAVPLIGSGGNILKLQEANFDMKSLSSERTLIYVLENPVEFEGNKMSLKDLIGLWAIADDAGKEKSWEIINNNVKLALGRVIPAAEIDCNHFSYNLVEESKETVGAATLIIPIADKKVEVKLANGC